MAATLEVSDGTITSQYEHSVQLAKDGVQVEYSELVPNARQESPEDAVNDEPDASDWIISSPYVDEDHQLDLQTLALPFQRFALALTTMSAIRPDYATAPYKDSFNWDEIVHQFVQASNSTGEASPEPAHFYVIVFRSRIKPLADRSILGDLDKAAHREAVEAGGLLKYWFGAPDHNGRNLATCLWRNRADARLGGAGPGHSAAMQAAIRMYDEWYVERYRLSVDIVKETWTFSPWSDEFERAAPS